MMYQPNLRRKKNNVPILSRKEIDDIAEGYVLDFCPEAVTTPQPLNVDLFLEEYLGLTLDYQYLSNDARYLGMTVFNDTSKIIVFLPEHNMADYHKATAGTVIIEASLTEGSQINRYRYTGGHEAGHWLFHRAYYNYDPNQLTLFEMDTPYIQCRELTPAEHIPNTKTWDDKRWMEWQADKYSSCFLMPKTAVRKVLDSTDISRQNEDALILMVANIFQVSEAAATYRLMDLGILRSKVQAGQMTFI